MVRSSPELKKAWFGSILFHILVAVALFFTNTAGSLPEPQFVELTWGASVSTLAEIPKTAIETGTPVPANEQPPASSDNSVALPTRTNITSPEEAINLPATKKFEANEGPSSASTLNKNPAAGNREPVASSGVTGSKDTIAGRGSFRTANVSAPIGYGSVGNSIGDNVSYAIQWTGGGNRGLLKGDLPKYPSGVNLNAQIKLRVVVQPRGTIKSVQPLRKGDTRLENAAIKEVRSWRFEPLQSAQPALDQVCTITFNFKVK